MTLLLLLCLHVNKLRRQPKHEKHMFILTFKIHHNPENTYSTNNLFQSIANSFDIELTYAIIC